MLANTAFGLLSLQYASSATVGAPKETKAGTRSHFVYVLFISLKLNDNLIITLDFLCQADGEHASASPIHMEKQGDNAGGSSSSSSSSDSGSSSSGNLIPFLLLTIMFWLQCYLFRLLQCIKIPLLKLT